MGARFSSPVVIHLREKEAHLKVSVENIFSNLSYFPLLSPLFNGCSVPVNCFLHVNTMKTWDSGTGYQKQHAEV